MLDRLNRYVCTPDSRILNATTYGKLINAIEGQKELIGNLGISEYISSLDPSKEDFGTKSIELLRLLIEHNRKVQYKDSNEQPVGALFEMMVKRTTILKDNPGAIHSCIKLAEKKGFICLSTFMKKITDPELFKTHSALTMIFMIADHCRKDNNWDNFFSALKSSHEIFKDYINEPFKGRILLEHVCISGRSDIINGLLDLGAKCNIASPDNGRYPLHSIIESTEKNYNEESIVVIQVIYNKYQAALQVADYSGSTPLLYASAEFSMTKYYDKLALDAKDKNLCSINKPSSQSRGRG
ncbi:hypothetical protein I862_02495 [endosymbiont of Acanthamoeba sp. UWC8]|uniref:hypothetical protein n=1 Tax=endosymbiont of Acanthamoeba sp. UWC8 TaxID=86106 RepID=UPI0004D0C306|nr:hypothetical protein [endosymbiont of Acanthamoeba sp. UWC8]AIF81062.1 hypothetical protein I862_02495 [endosymbiont of Acanthamoeba sp. UWC8]